MAGFRVEAFDAAASMVNAAIEFTGLSVRHMRFEDFSWEHSFEGIWACASLLHVTRKDLPHVVGCLAEHLVSDRVLCVSFKLGEGERVKDGRHFADMTEETLSTVLDDLPLLRQVGSWRSEDCRPDRVNEIWLNALLRKV